MFAKRTYRKNMSKKPVFLDTFLGYVQAVDISFRSLILTLSLVAREMMEYQLMTAQIRVHVLDLEEILPQPVAENLAQAVIENGNSLLPKRQEAGQRPESSSELASGR